MRGDSFTAVVVDKFNTNSSKLLRRRERESERARERCCWLDPKASLLVAIPIFALRLVAGIDEFASHFFGISTMATTSDVAAKTVCPSARNQEDAQSRYLESGIMPSKNSKSPRNDPMDQNLIRLILPKSS